jgi:signal transduction histidine kinase
MEGVRHVIDWLPRIVARIRASVHAKLLGAFLVIVVLLLAAAGVAHQALKEVNRRAEDMVKLQRKIAAYRQLNHDTTGQLYSVASSLVRADEADLEATLRQLKQFGYDLDRLQFVAQAEIDVMARVRTEYEKFIGVVTQAVELIRVGEASEGRDVQLMQVTPLAERLDRLTNELVNKAEADMVVGIEASQEAYVRSQRTIVIAAVVTILLALLLGYAISQSLIDPVKRMETRMHEIAAGDFAQQVDVPNRDELGALAVNLNRMSAELGRLYGQLEAANRHKSEFLASMSHELRTPLSSIIGFSDSLSDGMFGAPNERQLEYLRYINHSGHHLLSMINDILDLSKSEAGRMDLQVAKFDMPAAIGNAVALMSERARRTAVAIDVRIDQELNSFVGDERKFKQILLNLLSNAVKFTPSGGEIAVVARATARGVQVSVRDTGIGIAPEQQEAVFEAFHQIGSEYTTKREGTGLGLTLVRQFVRLHGGDVWLESELNKGSTFTFTLAEQAC